MASKIRRSSHHVAFPYRRGNTTMLWLYTITGIPDPLATGGPLGWQVLVFQHIT
jgi:hypothetical protein